VYRFSRIIEHFDARHLCNMPSGEYQRHERYAQACVIAYAGAVMLVVVVLKWLCCEEGCTSKAWV
jgi:hypothetical protein